MAGNNIIGEDGGSGWDGAWRDQIGSFLSGSVTSTANLTSPGFSYDDLPVAGNKLSLQADSNNGSHAFRNFSSTIGGANAGEIWISVIADSDQAGDTASWLMFYNGADNNTVRIFGFGAGNATGQNWGILVGGNAASSVAKTEQSFLLVRLFYDADGLDSMSLWVNPTLVIGALGAADAVVTGLAGGGAFDRVRVFGSAGHSTDFDEIRIGTTLFDVGVIPEPGSLALLAVASLAVLRRRGCRR